MKPLKYAVIGTGAIGGYYGGMLAKAGREVHFLFHNDYQQALKEGLQVESTSGDFKIQPIHAYASTKDMPQCDVLLVCIKTINNRLLPDMLRPLIHPGTTIVMIQNGLGMEADLAEAFPDTAICGAMAFICSNKVGPAHIHQMDYGSITIGNYRKTSRTTLEAIIRDFKEAGTPATLADDLLTARWKKLVWNIPYNGLTVVLHAQTDQLMSQPETRALLRDIMEETIAAANASGAAIPLAFASEMLTSTDQMKPYSPSMLLDYENHRRMEIGYLYSNPIRVAAENGYDMKKTKVIEQALCFIQAQQTMDH